MMHNRRYWETGTLTDCSHLSWMLLNFSASGGTGYSCDNDVLPEPLAVLALREQLKHNQTKLVRVGNSTTLNTEQYIGSEDKMKRSSESSLS